MTRFEHTPRTAVDARSAGSAVRVRARVTGTVQGVGFRPHVHRLAGALGLAGWVLNDELGVLLEIEGGEAQVERCLSRLRAEAPPLANVERIDAERVDPTGEPGFEIVESDHGGEPAALVSPDTTTCADCLRELLDPDDRRHRYPFINCTNCGPRFTIVRGVPYDRPLTTMSGFEMCAACRAEYADPDDRRFHAQPNACHDCGPSLRLLDPDGRALGVDPLHGAVEALVTGRIVAVKGLGGYHLACRADDERAVAALRSRKHREHKPFAVMAPDLETARSLVQLAPAEEELLLGRERPIVIARRRAGSRVAPSVAPRSPELGVVLPYSPLHHLLLADVGVALVMTSANVSDEPIAYLDDEALERLAGIADLFLVHDRPIHMRTDDSVARARAGGPPLMIRRSRGYVPASIDLPVCAARPVLACGAELKSTFCLSKGSRAWLSHHIGDLENWETLRSFREGVEHFERLFAVRPELVAHDLHPDYLSTTYALEREDVELVGVQHHHAHFAACLAEHGTEGPAVGAIYDGTGYGGDGTVWGGELLVGGLAGFERAGRLRAVRMPGGAQAIREPWRMACAWLAELGGDVPERPVRLADAVASERWEMVSALALGGLASPVTTSVGRLFDAVAALCGICPEVSYEGQAAVELEALAARGGDGRYQLPIERDDDGLVLDAGALVAGVLADLDGGAEPADVAARFIAGLAAGTAEVCALVASERALDAVALSGGVFQNRLLLERTSELLAVEGLRVLVPERLPCNDGGIAYGQAAVAVAQSLSTPALSPGPPAASPRAGRTEGPVR